MKTLKIDESRAGPPIPAQDQIVKSCVILEQAAHLRESVGMTLRQLRYSSQILDDGRITFQRANGQVEPS